MPWWSPPDRLDARQTMVLGLLAGGSLIAGYVNTLFTQTVHRATDEFHVGHEGQGVAATAVRLGIVLALPLWYLADRLGRRRAILFAAWAAPCLAAVGAIAPSFVVLTATQTLARPLAISLDLLIAVVATEEVPRSCRTYALSILAMSAGLGAGICVVSLPLADIGPRAWRLVYLVPLALLVIAVSLQRHLPETHRFQLHKGQPAPAVRGRRFWILVAAAAIGNVFVAPASVFQNRYLEDVRGYSNTLISAFTLGTQTPGGLGLLVGGKLADLRGRRHLAVGCLLGATALTVTSYAIGGGLLWLVAIVGSVLGGLAYPALAVYRTELFPTGNRGLAGGLVTMAALLGGGAGLLIAGAWLDHASYATVMSVLGLCEVLVAALVLTTYPETAHKELEELNPQDRLTTASTVSSHASESDR
jgi:MFS family permease